MGWLAVAVSAPSQQGWGGIAGLGLAFLCIAALISALRGR